MIFLARQLVFAALAAAAEAQLMCNGSFATISASTYVKGLNPGWNAGNTMDAMPTETSWGQPLLVNSTFTNVKNHGFKSVRLPGMKPLFRNKIL
jgi:endoglucanase